MVVVQLVAFGRVSENRGQRKARKAARLEKDRLKKVKFEKLENESPQIMYQTECHVKGWDGACDFPEDGALKLANRNGYANGGNKIETESEGSMTETSEEEMNLV